MNKFQLKGIAIYLLGKVQENTGWIVGNQHQQARGFENQINGKAKIAIGNAQKLSKNCVKHQVTPSLMLEHKSKNRNQFHQ